MYGEGGIGILFFFSLCRMGLHVCQARAVLKWLHPGCRGNVFECYFQPISGCVIAAEDILRARQLNHTSVTGDYFDVYPLRNERILILHGLPVSGPCGLCMDQVCMYVCALVRFWKLLVMPSPQWTTNGHFFDGLYVMGVR